MLASGWDPEKLELHVATKFSMTRFANFLYLIYKHLRASYAGLIKTLDEVKELYHDSTDAKQRERAMNADTLEGTIYTVKWSLSLSVNCDIYQVYGIGVDILQVKFNLSLKI